MIRGKDFKGWEVLSPENHDEYIHIIPINDSEEHLYHVACPCNPKQSLYNLSIVKHIPFDGREG